jgi:two-component system chemotaxis response regulator CheB
MPIPTLIVDDTITYRKILSEAAGAFPELGVVGTAPSGSIALKKMAQMPVRLVLLDIHMPDMDGVETLRHIKTDFPDTFVVMVSGISSRGADTTIKALELGALDFIRKPDGATPEENFKHLVDDLRPVVRLVEMRQNLQESATVRKKDPLPEAREIPEPRQRTAGILPSRFSVVAIGVSTGGPEALSRLIPQLPGDLGVPVVLVQHMPPIFTRSLADSLAKKSKLRVVEAEEGQVVSANIVYIAQGGRHMTVRQSEEHVAISLNDGPPENSCRPAVDVLFRSVASVYGEKGVLAVILTGMGNDGCSGVRTLKRKSCLCISQTEAPCVVYGMPRAIDEARLSDVSLPIGEIAEEIVLRVKR